MKVLSKINLQNNIKYYKAFGKNICAMVKADAYGHGIEDVVSIISDNVDYFGVSNIFEAKLVKDISNSENILIVGKEQNFEECKKFGFQYMVEDLEEIEKSIKINSQNLVHLKIDCGMNRFGIKNLNLWQMNNFYEKNIKIKGIFTHFPCLSDKSVTIKNYKSFQRIRNSINSDFYDIVHFGGSDVIGYGFDYDMIRVGIGLYGYDDNRFTLPVMKIFAKVVDIKRLMKGEMLGYDYKYRAEKDIKIAVLSIGYGDGLSRLLTGHYVVLNNKKCQIVGNICMDVCFVEIEDDNIKIGDYAEVLCDTRAMAKKMNTSVYEVLTNFTKLRGLIEFV